jgi:hypothetical protein
MKIKEMRVEGCKDFQQSSQKGHSDGGFVWKLRVGGKRLFTFDHLPSDF